MQFSSICFPSLNSALPHLGRLSLADNPWSCQCDFVRKFVVLFASSETRDLVVVDLEQARCYSADEEAYIDLEANVTWKVLFSRFSEFYTSFWSQQFKFLPAASACWSISLPCKKVKGEQTTNHSFKSEGDQDFQIILVV